MKFITNNRLGKNWGKMDNSKDVLASNVIPTGDLTVCKVLWFPTDCSWQRNSYIHV